MIDYQPLWDTMKEQGVSTYALRKKHQFSKGTLDMLKHNHNVTLKTVENLCHILNVPIEQIVRISLDDEEKDTVDENDVVGV